MTRRRLRFAVAALAVLVASVAGVTPASADKYFAKLYQGYTAAQKEIVWRDLSTNSVRTDGWARPSILERPKVIYNKATGKWIMWVHSDGPSSPTSTSTYAGPRPAWRSRTRRRARSAGSTRTG